MTDWTLIDETYPDQAFDEEQDAIRAAEYEADRDDGGPVDTWTDEAQADYAATQQRAIEHARRFTELANEDGDYWNAIEMERFTRWVLRDEEGAAAWRALVELKRARFNAQIIEEMKA